MFRKEIYMKKGFTLIELVIVIVILGILVAAVLPKVIGLTDLAKKNSTIAAKNAINSAINMFTATNSSFPSTTADLAGCFASGQLPFNKQVNLNNAVVGSGDPTTSDYSGYNCGWVYSSTRGRVWCANNTSW